MKVCRSSVCSQGVCKVRHKENQLGALGRTNMEQQSAGMGIVKQTEKTRGFLGGARGNQRRRGSGSLRRSKVCEGRVTSQHTAGSY